MFTCFNVQICAAFLAKSLAVFVAERLDRDFHRHELVYQREEVDISVFGEEIISVLILLQVGEREQFVKFDG